ncbi:AGE family epimerase/isomerase [Rhizobium sp. L1K21]|uniref:AGE family epimerase/isomerase n=1 Tax=Rhizobium sp. L1K21 TaxID=2954933 RepID=UPI002092F422|nr:AGE family epimerase/isomerase [Rhizobium sp. L1K21]MCO6186616.1 AGE family epimerase/isomerase [Rhizobium sp. L1K21]
MNAFVDFEKQVQWFENWLEKAALPLWASAGFDPETGGFYERLAQDGKPCVNDNRRARVQPRQVYCLVVGGLRGYKAEWKSQAEAAFAWFETAFKRSDGLYGALVSPDGELVDADFDLYNHAFALFGMAQIARAFPERHAEMEAKATALLDVLKTRYKHPLGGFHMDNPPKEPLCSNPHMHLFETAQEWAKIAKDKAVWNDLADEIAALAMTRFIDSETGALREFFAQDWTPMAGDEGRVVETGHQFEWAWLLLHWAVGSKSEEGIAKAKRLYEIGKAHGISESRRVAFMALNDDFTPRDEMARLWPQPEWMKASALLAMNSTGQARETYLADAAKACEALRLFLEPCKPGLWLDKMKPDGSFVDEPAPASTFYHIVCAIYELADIRDWMAAQA